MKRICLILLASLFFMSPVMAAVVTELKPQLILNQIKALKTQESDGDELYIDLGIFGDNLARQYIRIPNEPGNWQSATINKIKSLPLWTDAIKPGQTIHLELSLIESDASVLNPDDLIGTVRVSLKNEGGVLKANWSLPNHVSGPLAVSNNTDGVQTFELTGSNARYELSLSIKK